MRAKDIHVGHSFSYEGKSLTRVLFEGNTEVLYRCVMNIAAIMDHSVDIDMPNWEIMFIPLNEDIMGVSESL